MGMLRSRASEARCVVLPPSSATTPATLGSTWLMAGPARLKMEIAARVDIDAESLPYRPDVVARLREEHAAGRKILLATGTPRKFAEAIVLEAGISAYYVETADLDEDGYLDIEAAGTVAVSGLDGYHRATRLARLPYAKP